MKNIIKIETLIKIFAVFTLLIVSIRGDIGRGASIEIGLILLVVVIINIISKKKKKHRT